MGEQKRDLLVEIEKEEQRILEQELNKIDEQKSCWLPKKPIQ